MLYSLRLLWKCYHLTWTTTVWIVKPLASLMSVPQKSSISMMKMSFCPHPVLFPYQGQFPGICILFEFPCLSVWVQGAPVLCAAQRIIISEDSVLVKPNEGVGAGRFPLALLYSYWCHSDTSSLFLSSLKGSLSSFLQDPVTPFSSFMWLQSAEFFLGWSLTRTCRITGTWKKPVSFLHISEH